LLLAISRSVGLDVVADGYVRTERAIPANLEVADYPLKQLLESVARPWGSDVRFFGSGETLALVRAKAWWMEDAADVPEPLFTQIKTRLSGERKPRLDDLLLFAELSKAQAHKLYEAGLCPAAKGLIQGLWYDDTGPKPVLQFFNRLPANLKQRVQSEMGLDLRDAPQELVETWLAPTLIASVGLPTPKAQAATVLMIRPLGEEGTENGWKVVFVRPNGRHWERNIGQFDSSHGAFNPLN
jgi:hypothetical protein